jgi:hypothetical protein
MVLGLVQRNKFWFWFWKSDLILVQFPLTGIRDMPFEPAQSGSHPTLMETNSKPTQSSLQKERKLLSVTNSYVQDLEYPLFCWSSQSTTQQSEADLLLYSTVYVLFLGNALKLLHWERALSLLIPSVAALCKW